MLLTHRSGFISLLLFALALRCTFYTGVFGSDEVSYLSAALKLVDGDWRMSDYIGETRYGVNIPLALSLYFFGENTLSANLVSMLFSISEVALVFYFSLFLFGSRVAFLSGLIMAALPLHIHFSGRMMADSILAFFITASFVLFWLAHKKAKIYFFFLSGVSIGCVFWVKEVVLIYSFAFLLLPIATKKLKLIYLITPLSAFSVVILNLLFFYLLTGDMLYILTLLRHHLILDDNPLYYFYHIFLNIKHTWLVGYLSLLGLLMMFVNKIDRNSSNDRVFLLVWALGLLTTFSFLIIDTSPLRLIPKQVNYMTIFMAPLCILSGYFLANLKRIHALSFMFLYLFGAIYLSGMEQQAIRNFVANSKAIVKFAQENPDSRIYAMTNARRIQTFDRYISIKSQPHTQVLIPLKEAPSTITDSTKTLVMWDEETMAWGHSDQGVKVDSCWYLSDIALTPTGYGIGKKMLGLTYDAVSLFPTELSGAAISAMHHYLQPKSLKVYEIKAECNSLTAAKL